LLGEDLGLAEIHKLLYRCHDGCLEHKQALFDIWSGAGRPAMFNLSFDVLLYDDQHLFEADPPFAERTSDATAYSRDHRPDCVQVVIAFGA